MSGRATVTIERLGLDGEGVAPGPVRVARALPGETVEGEVIESRIDAPRILTPSALRVSPPCPHYRSCGGCALQHASDAFVAEWKADVVRSALARRGIEVDAGPTITSPPASRRRATLAGRRTKAGAMVGFHARASHTVTAVPECRLLHPELLATFPFLEALTRAGASRRGEVALSITRTAAGPDIAVSDARPLDATSTAELGRLAETHGIARLAWNGEVLILRAPPTQVFGRAPVEPPSGGFLQATEEGEAALTAFVRSATCGAARVLDLFAGAGTFSLPLAEKAEVHAVEADAEALAALDRGWRRAADLRRITTEVRDLFRRPLVADELARHDAAVIDPPRAGAEAQMRALAVAGPPVVVSLSCNPLTFARDAAILVDGGYSAGPVLVVDQFRWSAHAEIAARFHR